MASDAPQLIDLAQASGMVLDPDGKLKPYVGGDSSKVSEMDTKEMQDLYPIGFRFSVSPTLSRACSHARALT